ncbi:MAG: HPr family phosphocarrier protein [Ruminococcus sp.]|nr:HPr family phosphocarrier protein [Ruminococcus sp.]
MTKAKISLLAINDVYEFVAIVSRFPYDIDLISGRYAVDAKSIMGIFSLDLTKPIELNAHTDDADELIEKLDKYIIK